MRTFLSLGLGFFTKTVQTGMQDAKECLYVDTEVLNKQFEGEPWEGKMTVRLFRLENGNGPPVSRPVPVNLRGLSTLHTPAKHPDALLLFRSLSQTSTVLCRSPGETNGHKIKPSNRSIRYRKK